MYCTYITDAPHNVLVQWLLGFFAERKIAARDMLASWTSQFPSYFYDFIIVLPTRKLQLSAKYPKVLGTYE